MQFKVGDLVNVKHSSSGIVYEITTISRDESVIEIYNEKSKFHSLASANILVLADSSTRKVVDLYAVSSG